MKYVILLVVAVLVILLATFGIQNPFPVRVRFFQFQSDAVPLYVVILLSALLGILVNSLLGIPGRIHRYREVRGLWLQVAEHAQQIDDLKARMPLPVMKPLPNE